MHFYFTIFYSEWTSEPFIGKNGTEWSRKPTDDPPSTGEFDEALHGLTNHSRSFQTAREAFELFMSDEMLSTMVKYTNMFASSKNRKWHPVTKPEMRAFIAILIAAGRMHMNDLNTHLLWQSDDICTPSFFKLAMSRDRFKDIYNFWRFDDKSTRKRRFRRSQNKLEPIKTIYNDFVERCIRNYNPGKHLTIDERLCVFRGKYLSIRKFFFKLFQFNLFIFY